MNPMKLSYHTLQKSLVVPFISILLGAGTPVKAATALEEYVRKPDPAYHYDLVKTLRGEGFTQYVLEMTSQTWLKPEEVDRTLWKHWVRIVKPDRVEHETGLLIIGGGANGGKAPSEIDKRAAGMALETHSVITELGMVPNQPLRFAGDDENRKEDALIAFGWNKFLHGGRAEWLARLPMTKSAVRAMDTVTDFLGKAEQGGVTVDKFVVAGGSKRGWTTWTTGAVDDRVVAIVPIVIDMLNMVPSFEHHYRTYGFFAPAVGDYESMGIMNWQRTPEYRRLLEIVEPFEYRSQLTKPKFLINASGDQFFVPDSGQFYWSELSGEKHVRYVPNADHGLNDSDAVESLVAFYHSILTDHPRPNFDWQIGNDGSLSVNANDVPKQVLLWQASNPDARDFRMETLGPVWKSQPVVRGANGKYEAHVSKPAKGFTAFFMELTYPGPGHYPLKFTTQVKVMPDVYQHPAFVPKSVSEK